MPDFVNVYAVPPWFKILAAPLHLVTKQCYWVNAVVWVPVCYQLNAVTYGD